MLASGDRNGLKPVIELIPSAEEQEPGASAEIKANVQKSRYGRMPADSLELRKGGVDGKYLHMLLQAASSSA